MKTKEKLQKGSRIKGTIDTSGLNTTPATRMDPILEGKNAMKNIIRSMESFGT